jgi:uncharacterized membrane protein
MISLMSINFLILVAFYIFQLYHRSETTPHAEHALKRNPRIAVIWILLHFPLIIFFAATGRLLYVCIQSTSVNSPYAKSAVGGVLNSHFTMLMMSNFAFILICISFLQLCHRDIDQSNNRYLSRRWMIGGRLLTGLAFVFLGALTNLSPKDAIYTTAGILTFCVIFEEVFCDGFIKSIPREKTGSDLTIKTATANNVLVSMARSPM